MYSVDLTVSQTLRMLHHSFPHKPCVNPATSIPYPNMTWQHKWQTSSFTNAVLLQFPRLLVYPIHCVMTVLEKGQES
jgi:hypothetical protein